MKRLLLIAMLALSAHAHPGVGIVIDSRGNLFYTDLEQVWRIAANGATGIAAPNVHTHELYLDAQDNLYGEHLWYNGETLKTWGSRVWKRSPDGNVVDVVPSHPGFNEDTSFVRDGAGNMYIARRDENVIERCVAPAASPAGPPAARWREQEPPGRRRSRRQAGGAPCVVFAHAPFHDIRWMTVTPGGTLYLIDVVDLVRITPDGRVTTIARDLSGKREKHQVMGVWTDPSENVYVADYANRAVKRIDRHGRVEIIERSTFPWSPTGGTFAKNGDLWLLEATFTNSVRVRRVRR